MRHDENGISKNHTIKNKEADELKGVLYEENEGGVLMSRRKCPLEEVGIFHAKQFYGLGGLDHNLLRVALATFLEVRGSTYPAIVAAKANQRCCGLSWTGIVQNNRLSNG